ncbi:MAG: DUF167 domain-containing protein [Alphaproteobacteria bacterium]
MSGPSPLVPVPDGLKIFVRLQPRARRAAIEGVVTEADGRTALRVAVTAPPEDGKANAALVALLGKKWKLPKSAFTIVGGAADRRKTLLLRGDSASLLAALRACLESESK